MKSLLAVGVERDTKGKQEDGARKMENKKGRREGDQQGCQGQAAQRTRVEAAGARGDGNRGCREVEQESERQGRSELKRGPGNQDDALDPKRGRVLTASPHGLFA